MGRFDDHLLVKSPLYGLVASEESVSLIFRGLRRPNRVVTIERGWGFPEVGLIDEAQRWCAVGGRGVLVYALREPFADYAPAPAKGQWWELFREPPAARAVLEGEQTGEERLDVVLAEEGGSVSRHSIDLSSWLQAR